VLLIVINLLHFSLCVCLSVSIAWLVDLSIMTGYVCVNCVDIAAVSRPRL